MKTLNTYFYAIFLLLISVNAANAQEQFAILEGVVADAKTGEFIPFANILIKSTQGINSPVLASATTPSRMAN